MPFHTLPAKGEVVIFFNNDSNDVRPPSPPDVGHRVKEDIML